MGPQPNVSENLTHLLTDLYGQPGVCGACLQVNDTVLVHDLPFSDDRIAALAQRIHSLIAGYENVGRSIWQICAGFEKYRLLILCRSNTRLSILLQPTTDPALIAGRATRLLMEVEIADPVEAPPEDHAVEGAPILNDGVPRAELERIVTGLLSRVTGSMTATKLIQRQLKNRDGIAMFSKDEAREIGLAVLESIPNRGKREALASEFLNALNL